MQILKQVYGCPVGELLVENANSKYLLFKGLSGLAYCLANGDF